MNIDDMIEFLTDPLRLTLIIAGVAVLFAILVFGRRNNREFTYKGRSQKDYSFGSPPADMLVDEEVIVLPRRKTEREIIAEKKKDPHFGAIDETPISLAENFSVIPEVEPQEKEVRVTEAAESPVFDEVQVEEPVAEVVVEKPQEPTQEAVKKFVVLHVLAEEGAPFTGKAIFDATQTLGMALGKHHVFHYPADAAYVGDSAFCLVNMSTEGAFDIESLDSQKTSGISLILTLPTNYSDGLTVFSNMLAVAHALVKKLGSGDLVDQTRTPLTAELVANIQADIAQFESRLSPSVLET